MPPKKTPTAENVEEIRKSLDILIADMNGFKEMHKQHNEVPQAEDAGEIRRTLEFLTGETSVIKIQQEQLLDLVKEVKHLWTQNAEKDKKIIELERT